MAEQMLTARPSLDGVMQAPGRPEEDPSGGLSYGKWIDRLVRDRSRTSVYIRRRRMS